jgi:hypothetical protein
MRAIDVLDELHENGKLIELAKAGLVSTSILIYRKVYHAYEFQLLNGVKKTQAITDIGDVFGISERMVYRIINKLK